MRQVLSWRFVAAVAAVLALVLVVYVIQAQQDGGSAFVGAGDADERRRMDVVALVQTVEHSDFQMTPQGTVSGNLALNVMVNGQPTRVPVFPGTRGVVSPDCDLTGQFRCAVLGQSLGDTLVWFALMPLSGEFRFRLPAIVDLEDGYAHLVNGWEVPYANRIDRSQCDAEVASFSEFLNEHEGDFESVYDLTADAIVAVVC